MNLNKKFILVCLLLLATLMLVTGCGGDDPYEVNDSLDYNVSIKFDASGGAFTTSTPVIVDSYNVSEMAVNADGNVEIPLIAPDNEARGADAHKATRTGYFLVGWYAQRTESTDADGNVTYTYAEPWDFATDRVQVDPNEKHSSKEPVLTLYAAWAPEYEIEFYDMDSGDLLGEYRFSPAGGAEVQVPAWNSESGALDMYKFPKREGYTFMSAYYDAEGTQPVETETITHPAVLNADDATVTNGTLKLYTSWKAGEWYRISTAEQFIDNFSLSGCYEIQADLDFTDKIWPTAMMHGNFAGIIQGNGHTIRNITLTQTDNSKVYTGLFGNLTDTASLQGVTFENVTLTIKKGSRVTGAAYGLLAGNISANAAVQEVTILNGQLQIDSGCYFASDDYAIGLVCGMGSIELDASGITCTAVGDKPENVSITVTENTVDVEFLTQ